MTSVSLHHIAIQTPDLSNSVAWYKAFFGATVSWSLGQFSPLTRERLSGIKTLSELVVGGLRFHVFERSAMDKRLLDRVAPDFQHVCLKVETAQALIDMRERWFTLFHSGDYAFASAELATPIVVDQDGVQSFYALDPNGLEFELTFVPAAHR